MGQYISKLSEIPDLVGIVVAPGQSYVRNATDDGWEALELAPLVTAEGTA